MSERCAQSRTVCAWLGLRPFVRLKPPLETSSLREPLQTPHHKDFASFDFEATPVEEVKIHELTKGEFTGKAQNLIFVGGAGTGKTYIATALGTALIQNGQKVRFFNAVDLINAQSCGHVDWGMNRSIPQSLRFRYNQRRSRKPNRTIAEATYQCRLCGYRRTWIHSGLRPFSA